MKFAILLCLLIGCVGHLGPQSALAEPAFDSSEFSEQELQIQERARKRLYPGGRDEEDIKVYEAAVMAERKLNRRLIEKDVYKQLFSEELAVPANEEADEAVVEE